MTRRAARQPPPARQALPVPGQAPPGEEAGPGGDAAADLDAYVAELVAAAPPLASEQRDRLALILRASRRPVKGMPEPPVPGAGPPHGPA
jgi:hypothetical protein